MEAIVKPTFKPAAGKEKKPVKVTFPQYLYDNPLFSDVTIRLDPSGESFRCHRAVLGTIPYLLERLKVLEEANNSGVATPKASVSRTGSTHPAGEKNTPVAKEHALVLKLSRHAFHILRCFIYQITDKLEDAAYETMQFMAYVLELSNVVSLSIAKTMWKIVESQLADEVDDALMMKYIGTAASAYHQHLNHPDEDSRNYVLPLNRLGYAVPWSLVLAIDVKHLLFVVKYAKSSVGMLWLLMWGAVSGVTAKDFTQAVSLLPPNTPLPTPKILVEILSRASNDVVTRFVLSHFLRSFRHIGTTPLAILPLEFVPIVDGEVIVGEFDKQDLDPVFNPSSIKVKKTKEAKVDMDQIVPRAEDDDPPVESDNGTENVELSGGNTPEVAEVPEAEVQDLEVPHSPEHETAHVEEEDIGDDVPPLLPPSQPEDDDKDDTKEELAPTVVDIKTEDALKPPTESKIAELVKPETKSLEIPKAPTETPKPTEVVKSPEVPKVETPKSEEAAELVKPVEAPKQPTEVTKPVDLTKSVDISSASTDPKPSPSMTSSLPLNSKPDTKTPTDPAKKVVVEPISRRAGADDDDDDVEEPPRTHVEVKKKHKGGKKR